MKKLLAGLMLVLAISVGASTPSTEAMYLECVRQMAQGSCLALADPGSFTEEQLNTQMTLVVNGAVHKVLWRDFLAVRGIGSVSPTDVRMCDVAKAYCDANDEDSRCKVGKALWGG
jgi:hypothetical protein